MIARLVGLFLIALCLIAASPPAAALTLACLPRQEMQDVIASQRVVAPNVAVRAARQGAQGADLVRVRLCRHNDAMMYVVTFLRRDGRVVPVLVEAGSGRLAVIK